MRIVILITIVQIVAARPVWAQLVDSAQMEFVNELNGSLGLSDMVKRVGDGKIDDNKIRVIAEILRNTNEVEIHRMRGHTENKTYLHPEGLREAVYDAKGRLVEDGVNDGSYNYFHPQKDALRHFTFDIAPWLLFGQSRNDPTSRRERVYAYSADLCEGVIRALAAPRTKGRLEDVNVEEPGCAEAVAVFLLAMERGNAEEMIRVFDKKERVGEQELVRVVRKFEEGLRTLFASAKVEQ